MACLDFFTKWRGLSRDRYYLVNGHMTLCGLSLCLVQIHLTKLLCFVTEGADVAIACLEEEMKDAQVYTAEISGVC